MDATKKVEAVVLIFVLSLTTIGGVFAPLFSFGALPPQQSGVSITVELQGGVPQPSPSLPGIFPYPFIPPPLGDLILRGFAPPNSFLTILKNGSVAATRRVESDGEFEAVFRSISATSYELGFFIEDREGDLSETITLSQVPVFRSALTRIDNIVIPPTLRIDTPQVRDSEDVTMHGFAPPRSNVLLYFFPSEVIKRKETARDGYWKITFPAKELGGGVHTVRARLQLPSGLLSSFSRDQKLTVGSGGPGAPPEVPPAVPPFPPGEELPSPFPPVFPPLAFLIADLNRDGRVDLIDLSLLLYNWGPPRDTRADFNTDAVVDLIDFSVMMFFWTG